MDLASQLVEAQEYARWQTAKILQRCPDDVDDVLQTAALKALRAAASFRGDSQFRVWFTRIAINQALMHLRKAVNSKKRFTSMDVSPCEDVDGPDFPSPTPSPEGLAMGGEIHRAVATEASKMSPILRDELRLMLIGVGPGLDNNRKSRRFRVRRILRKAMKERGML